MIGGSTGQTRKNILVPTLRTHPCCIFLVRVFRKWMGGEVGGVGCGVFLQALFASPSLSPVSPRPFSFAVFCFAVFSLWEACSVDVFVAYFKLSQFLKMFHAVDSFRAVTAWPFRSENYRETHNEPCLYEYGFFILYVSFRRYTP